MKDCNKYQKRFDRFFAEKSLVPPVRRVIQFDEIDRNIVERNVAVFCDKIKEMYNIENILYYRLFRNI